MGYIYKIENKINGKVYIGQTKNSIKRRWKQHRHAARHPNEKVGKAYFYEEIRKHGAENFFVSLLEECDNDKLNEREEYWISKTESYKPENGYNRTMGGTNGPIFDTSEICNLWDAGYSFSQIEHYTAHSRTTISKVLKNHDSYTKSESKERGSILASTVQYRPVVQYSQSGEELNRFRNPQEAVDYLGKGTYGELAKKCRKKNRMYYGYQWRFEGDEPPEPFIKRPELFKPVNQYDLEGNLVNTFCSITQASEITQLNYSGIQQCCSKEKNQYRGYKWRYA